MKKVYFPIGISGSGKSTYINKNFNKDIVVCPDDIRRELTGNVSNHTMEGKVWSTVFNRLYNTIEEKGEAVLDATNVDLKLRAESLSKIKKQFPGIKTIAIVFLANPEISKQRVKNDIDSGKDRSNVPDHVVDKQYEKFKRGYKAIKSQFSQVIKVGEKNESNMIKLKDLIK